MGVDEMRYPFSKEQYLSVQDKLYDAMTDICKEDKIANVEYKLVEKDLLYTPSRDIIMHRKYTANVHNWLEEIEWLKCNIVEELLLCLSYDRICNEFDSPLKGTLRYVNRERYLKLIVYDLFTFREKFSFLIYELFNRQIKIYVDKKVCSNNRVKVIKTLKNLKNTEVSFKKISAGLKIFDIFKENVSWIDEKEYKLICSVVNEFDTNVHVKNLKNIRNAFTHRSNPGIDCSPLRSYEYDEVDQETKQMLSYFDKSIGIKNSKKSRYIVKSSKPLEKEEKFGEIIHDVLEVWKLFMNSLKELLDNVSILKSEVDKFY